MVADSLTHGIWLVPRNWSSPHCKHSNVALGHLKGNTANTLPLEIKIASYKFRDAGTVDIERFIILAWVISWTAESTSSFLCVSETHTQWKGWLLPSSLSHNSRFTHTDHQNETFPKNTEILWYDWASTWGSSPLLYVWTVNTHKTSNKFLGLTFFTTIILK